MGKQVGPVLSLFAGVDTMKLALQPETHKQSFAFHDSHDLIAICATVILEETKSHTYSYTFDKSYDVASTLVGMYSRAYEYGTVKQ